tara:strand:- start:35 stop:169 length:135 start_codon:yes stop_codon:yes gene_type:complete
MMSETIYKIEIKKDKLKERLSNLDNLFEVEKDSSNNKNNKKEKN